MTSVFSLFFPKKGHCSYPNIPCVHLPCVSLLKLKWLQILILMAGSMVPLMLPVFAGSIPHRKHVRAEAYLHPPPKNRFRQFDIIFHQVNKGTHRLYAVILTAFRTSEFHGFPGFVCWGLGCRGCFGKLKRGFATCQSRHYTP